MSLTAKGILAALVSNILFAMLFFYGTLLSPMAGTDIFAWRMVGMCIVMAITLTSFSMWKKIGAFALETGTNWRRWALIVLPTPIAAGQLWLFMWAPLNGRGVDVAIGYFLFPLAMMLGGMLFFGEKLARKQQIAVALAVIGVALEIRRTGTFSAATVFVFATYPVYYLLRRWQRVPVLVGLFIDFVIILPFVLMYIACFSDSPAMMRADAGLWVWVLVLGAHAVLAMLLNLLANAWLPVVLFGILSYLEPALLFLISILFLGEPLEWASLVSYAFIWAAIVVMMRHSWQAVSRKRRGL